MRRLQESRETTRKTLVYLVQEFALSAHANNRKGGLIALASAAIGLGPQIAEHLDLLVPAITKSFNDPEARVRFYACESLFNLSKICRGAVLAFFGDIFAGICKLVADQDTDVKNGAALYDRLLKEVVMESERLDVERFIPLLRSHLRLLQWQCPHRALWGQWLMKPSFPKRTEIFYEIVTKTRHCAIFQNLPWYSRLSKLPSPRIRRHLPL
jgi:hypothetical protein